MADHDWWRHAVIYQVYPRSFADADGDGMGDLPGVISRLDYLADLGVDAVWLNPFYVSPQNDAGYDVADYRNVDPRFGDVSDAEHLIRQAHARGLRVLFDIVPNHTSSEHPWFVEAMRTPPGTGIWSRYHCAPGTGPDMTEPPNDWRSVFGGPGWSPIPDPDTGEPTGWWYLHLFDATQPDLNWNDPEVVAEHERVLRFWFDRGVDGFRIDVAHGLVKAEGYPDSGEPQIVPTVMAEEVPERPQWDQPGVHEIFRGWRRVADSYDPPRVFCGEVWVSTPEQHAMYLRPDELHTAFNFHFLKTQWDAAHVREIVDHSLATAGQVGAPCTWVLSNHDVWRHVSRFAPWAGDGFDLDAGLRRARAASLLMLGLPGSAYVYQGEELGLPEVVDLPDDVREDPTFHRTNGEIKGRDGCRVPVPWSGTEPSYGFGPGTKSWLPQPDSWARLSVAAQDGVPGSTLEMYRAALAVRRTEPALGDGAMEWLDLGEPDVVAFRRSDPEGADVVVVVNLGSDPVQLPASEVLVGSTPAMTFTRGSGAAGAVDLPAESAAWLRP